MVDMFLILARVITYQLAGIHLEKDMSVPFGHTVATTVCLFEILCAPKIINLHCDSYEHV